MTAISSSHRLQISTLLPSHVGPASAHEDILSMSSAHLNSSSATSASASASYSGSNSSRLAWKPVGSGW